MIEKRLNKCYGDDYDKNHFTKYELEVALILLDFKSRPVFFLNSETSKLCLKWGATKPRTGFVCQQQSSMISPSLVRKSSMDPEVMSNSPNSCLTGEAVKTPPKNRKEGLRECSSKYERLKRNSSTQRNIFPVMENLPGETEGFPIPVIQKHFYEHRRVARKERSAKSRQRRIAIRRSKKLKEIRFSHTSIYGDFA